MKAKGYERSTSFPKFFTTASKNNCIRQRSNFGRNNSRQRQNSTNRVESNGQGGSSVRSASKSFERPKGDYSRR